MFQADRALLERAIALPASGALRSNSWFATLPRTSLVAGSPPRLGSGGVIRSDGTARQRSYESDP
jgi:hypothetical protein